MAFTSITVTGTYKDEAGVALSGTVDFLLSTTLIDGSGDIRVPSLVTCTLSAGGTFSTSLVATDDPTTLPVGAVYEVRENVGRAVRVYYITVPYNSPGGALDLGTVTPAVVSSPSTTYATLTDVNRLSTYDIPFMVTGLPDAGAVVARFVSVRAWSLPAALTGSQGYAGTSATVGAAVFTVKKGAGAVGTVTFNTNGSIAFAAATATTFAAGDILTVEAPDPQNATLADVAVTLCGAAL